MWIFSLVELCRSGGCAYVVVWVTLVTVMGVMCLYFGGLWVYFYFIMLRVFCGLCPFQGNDFFNE